MNWSMHANFLWNRAPKDIKCLYKVVYCEKMVFVNRGYMVLDVQLNMYLFTSKTATRGSFQ